MLVSHPKKSKQVPRPLEHLMTMSKKYPLAWKTAEKLRFERGQNVPDWPDWCFLPLGGWYAVISYSLKLPTLPAHLISNISLLAALGSWRYTQSIYRFHPETFFQLQKTKMSGDLPCEVLTRLPEWCLYIDTPEFTLLGESVFGFFVHLERDANTGRDELRFLLDTKTGLQPFIIHLGAWPLEESLQRVKQEAVSWMNDVQIRLYEAKYDRTAAATVAGRLLSLVLYLCSSDPEYRGSIRARQPSPKRTKKGWRLFPADKPRYFDIGYEIGERILKARSQVFSTADCGRARPKPHIRRPHWHTYWTGPRTAGQTMDFRWLPAIPVNSDLVDEMAE